MMPSYHYGSQVLALGEKATQKTNLATNKTNLTSKENGEVQVPLTDKEKLGRDLKRLNDKLAFTLSKCNAKDEQIKKQTKIVQEAVASHVTLEQPKSNPALQDISLSSTTDIGSEDEVSYADS
ncbi:hypothetical protein glysoja_045696 [Glycine soja]|uniref:Uncharacterized protein n=1 Tax=Glycine soja TaxID=3848 RepID=A0A0B2SGS4_GLYSO|nr:hypothetical protein glysoja_045696 [Glycine soja]